MAENRPTVASLIAEISKQSDLKIGSFSDVVRPVQGFSTGNLAIDYVTGVGGFPVGRISELYGLPSSGKSTTATQAAARLQQQIIQSGAEEYILYLDYEHSLDKDYSAALGLDIEHPSFVLVQPAWLEQGAMIALSLIETGQVRLSIWDSVAAMTPKAEREGDFDQRTSAMNRARLIAALGRQLNSLLYENDSSAVFLNHLMEEIGMTGRPGPPKTTTPGGKALKYYSALRLEYRQVKNLKGTIYNELTGQHETSTASSIIKVKATKNKVATPFREVEVRVRYGTGFDEFWSALQILIAYKIVKQSGGYFYFQDEFATEEMETTNTNRHYLHGDESVLVFADTHPDWRDSIISAVPAVLEQPAPDVLVMKNQELTSEDDELSSLLNSDSAEV